MGGSSQGEPIYAPMLRDGVNAQFGQAARPKLGERGRIAEAEPGQTQMDLGAFRVATVVADLDLI